MKKIDKLFDRVKKIISDAIDCYSFNEDDFINALGCDPKDYEIVALDEVVGYDWIRALNDKTGEIWDDK